MMAPLPALGDGKAAESGMEITGGPRHLVETEY
jgi:hypothetical protein